MQGAITMGDTQEPLQSVAAGVQPSDEGRPPEEHGELASRLELLDARHERFSSRAHRGSARQMRPSGVAIAPPLQNAPLAFALALCCGRVVAESGGGVSGKGGWSLGLSQPPPPADRATWPCILGK